MTDFYSNSLIFALLSFVIATAFTPGPNNFLLLVSGIKFGLKKTLGHILGIAIGFPIMLIIIGILFNKILFINSTFFTILSIIGAIYLLYLCYQIIFSDFIFKEKETSKPITFLEALLFQWVNPKAWIMALSIATTYLTTKNFYYELIFIAFIFFIVAIFSSITWTLFGKAIKNTINIKLANVILGILLIISVIQMFPEKF